MRNFTQGDLLCGELIRTMQHTHQPAPPEKINQLDGWKPRVRGLAEALEVGGIDAFNKALATYLKESPLLGTLLASDTLQGATTPAATSPAPTQFIEFKGLWDYQQPEWLIYRFLPTLGRNPLFGPTGQGKTYLAILLSVIIASEDLEFLGRPTRHGHVIFVEAEDMDEVAQRFIGCALHYGLEDIPRLHIFPAPIQLIKDVPALTKAIKDTYGDIDVKLIVLDTLAACTLGIDENSKQATDPVRQGMDDLGATFKCCVMPIHHTGRAGAKARGSSAYDGDGSTMTKVELDDEKGVVSVQADKMRRVKKYAPLELTFTPVTIPGRFDEAGSPMEVSVLIPYMPESTEKTSGLEKTILTQMENLGSHQVLKQALMKACGITPKQEITFWRAITALREKGLIMKPEKRGRNTVYSLMPETDSE